MMMRTWGFDGMNVDWGGGCQRRSLMTVPCAMKGMVSWAFTIVR